MKKAKRTTKQKAELLRKFGFGVNYGKRGKSSPQHKAAVTRNWKRVSKFMDNEKQEFVFQRIGKRERKELRKGISKQQFTKEGFFHRKPKGAKTKPRYKVRKDSVVEYTARGRKGGWIHEEIHHIDPKLLAEDPPRAILAIAGKKDKVILTVNGFDSSQTREYTLEGLANYIALELLPRFLDPNLDEEYSKAHGKQKRSVQDFIDTFHIKKITHGKTAKTRKRGNHRNR